VIGVVHIHKTAGTTLASVFKRSFGARHCDVYSEDPSRPFSAEDLRRMRRRFYPRLHSVLGHDVRVYSDLEDAAGEVQWVTFLRDPVRRTASHYQYDRVVGGVDLPLEEWLTHHAVWDRQTRVIAGPDGTAEQAIALLPRFTLVGVTERFDESLVMMKRFVGMRDIRYASKWVAPTDDIKRQLLADPEAVAAIEAVNRNDLALYEHVVSEVFPKQVAEYGTALDTDVAWFRRSNKGMTRARMYGSPRYMAYVAKWRAEYRPWVERRRRAALTTR